MRKILIVAILTILTLQSNIAFANEKTCTNDKRVDGSCYTVRGSLIVFANMLPRLITLKTEEILRIARSIDQYHGDFMWPEPINKLIDPDTDVTGVFRVCPIKLAVEDPIGSRIGTVCIADLHTEPHQFHRSSN